MQKTHHDGLQSTVRNITSPDPPSSKKSFVTTGSFSFSGVLAILSLEINAWPTVGQERKITSH